MHREDHARRRPVHARTYARWRKANAFPFCEVLDRVLNKGVVVAGEVTISVADVDLLYLGLNLVLTSVETARESLGNGRAASRFGN